MPFKISNKNSEVLKVKNMYKTILEKISKHFEGHKGRLNKKRDQLTSWMG